MRTSWVLLSLLGALGAIAGGAAALNGQVTVTAGEGPTTVDPRAAPGTWQLAVTYNSATPITDDVQVALEPRAGSGLDARVEPPMITFSPEDTEPGAPRYTYTGEAVLHVDAHRYAPAYVAETVTVPPEVETDGLDDPAENPTRVTVTPAYRPGLAAEPVEDVVDLQAGERGHARAQLDSAANGESVVTVQDVQAPDGCEVEPIQEEVFLALAGQDEAVLHVTCPADADGGTVEVTFHQAYAPDRSLATTTATASWDLHVDGSAATQAGLAPASADTDDVALLAGLGLAAVAAAAVVRRRS